jgi:S1-C subfamily serine protease
LGANGVESFIQTDAAINAGNSGGALVNTNGELVGINAMLYSQTGSYSGYGFAIPTTMMNKVVEDLKKYGTVQRAMIGISGRDVKTQVDMEKEEGKDATDYGTMEGIYVAEVVDGSAAAEAGIEKGDVITEVDGQKLTKFGDLSGIIAQKRPGDKVTLTFLHNKKKQTKTVTLRNEQGNTKVVKNADLDVLGADFREVTKEQKQQLEIQYGLEVIKVNGGKMKEAGITKGFIIQRVNDEPMKTIEDLQEAVKDASTSKEPVLIIKGVFPSGKRGYFIVQLQNE